MVDIHDYDIQCIEQEILWKYEDTRHDYSDCDCLLSLRKDMINKRVLAHQEEILPEHDIVAVVVMTGHDSLDILQLLMRIEDQYGIVIPDQALAKFETVADVVAYLEQQEIKL